MSTTVFHEDAVSYLRMCSEGFREVAAIVATIKAETGEDNRARRLTGAALHIAENLGELAEYWREEVERDGVGER